MDMTNKNYTEDFKRKPGRPRLERVTRVINGNTKQTKVKSAKRVK